MTRDGFKWNMGPTFTRQSAPREIPDKLAELRRQVHSLTVENERLRGLLSRDERKAHKGLTRREKIEHGRTQCDTTD